MLTEWTLEDVTWTLRPQGDVRRIVLFLHGRNEVGPRRKVGQWELDLVAAGSVFCYPFYGPWGWMNEERAAFLDAVVDRLLGENGPVPLILAGGSMGGHAALLYAELTRHHFIRCQVNCPVTDLAACYQSLPEVRRSMVQAYLSAGVNMGAINKRFGILERVQTLPAIPYHVIHHRDDVIVPKSVHGDPLVSAMRELGHSCIYDEPNGPHCGDLSDIHRQRRSHFLLHGCVD